MKKFLKPLLFITAIIACVISALLFYCFLITSNVKFDESKLINASLSVTFYDKNDDEIGSYSEKVKTVSLDELPSYTVDAFVSIEDKNFFKHHGIDGKGIIRAAFKNLTSASFKEGGSTISQQLIKNTHLSSEKTFKRKLCEIKLTKELEKNLSKNEIIESYLNTVYFGKTYYGIASAANGYFNKNATELTLSESAALAAIIRAPNYYTNPENFDKLLSRRNLTLEKAFECGYISKNELSLSKNEPLTLNYSSKPEKSAPYVSLCLTELNEIKLKNSYDFKNTKVYTNFNPSDQKILTDAMKNDSSKCGKTAVLLKNENLISAYYSNQSDYKSQPASTLKPLFVYSPCLEENLINENTFIKDEKIDFGGYSPSNHTGVYYGDVSAKTALSKSLNSPAVKLLNSLTVSRAEKYINKFGVTLEDGEKGLSLALGGMEKGFTLKDLSSFYGVYRSGGIYYKPSAIRKIVLNNGVTAFYNEPIKKRVFSDATAYITSDMLKESVVSGTSKKLYSKDFNLYAKTGTVGTNGKNYAAYSISFINDATLGVKYSNDDNSPLPVGISGSSAPTETAAAFWKTFLKNRKNTSIPAPDSVTYAYVDKSEYLTNKKFVLAEDSAPEDEKLSMLFAKKYLPTERSTKYSEPKIENYSIKYRGDCVKIKVTTPDGVYAEIYKNGIKIHDTKYGLSFTDYDLTPLNYYVYEAIPYSETQAIKRGDKILLGKIKTNKRDIPDKWWDISKIKRNYLYIN